MQNLCLITKNFWMQTPPPPPLLLAPPPTIFPPAASTAPRVGIEEKLPGYIPEQGVEEEAGEKIYVRLYLCIIPYGREPLNKQYIYIHQTGFRLVSKQSEKCNYNANLV